MSTSPSSSPSRARQLLSVVCITGATVIPSYISGALTVALPSIGRSIGLTGSALQWPLSVFSLVIGAFLLLSGGLADGIGRRSVFLAGSAWMAVFSIPLALARDANEFIALCAVLGLGPAMLGPAATGILSESLPDGPVKNGAFAALGAGQPLGFILGLFFGGVFAKQHSIIFAVAAGASALFGGLALYFVPSLPVTGRSTTSSSSSSDTDTDTDPNRATGERPSRRISLLKFDWLGAALSATGLVGLTLALALAGTTSKGWKGPGVITLLPAAVVLLVSFFMWERQSQRQQSSVSSRHHNPSTASTTPSNPSSANPTSLGPGPGPGPGLLGPLIPPSIWSAPGFTASLACVWLSWFAFNSLTYYCTLFFQIVQGATPIETSIRFLPVIGAGIIANVLGGVLIGRVKAVYLILFGCTACAASCAIFALQDPAWPYARGMLSVLTLQVGPDLFFPVIQLFACKTVGQPRAALAGSLFNVTTRLATSIGLAICSLVQGAATQRYARKYSVSTDDMHAVMYGYRAAGWLCSASSGLAAVVALVYLRKSLVGVTAAGAASRTDVVVPVPLTDIPALPEGARATERSD